MTELLMGAAQSGTEDTSAFNARVTALEDQCGSETLTTTAQTLSGAVNELDDDLGDAETLLGSEALTTTAQTVTGAINELDNDIAHCAVRSYHTNEALTAADGKVTWEILTPRWQYCIASVYITSTGVEVTPMSVTHTTGKVTLELEADADVAVGYFTATVVG